MEKNLSVIIAVLFFIFGTVSLGMAGQGMKSDVGEKNVPGKIQRSTPSAEKSLPTGSGPGSRSDQLTETEEMDPKDPNLSNKKGKAAQAAEELEKKGKISSQSSSQQSR